MRVFSFWSIFESLAALENRNPRMLELKECLGITNLLAVRVFSKRTEVQKGCPKVLKQICSKSKMKTQTEPLNSCKFLQYIDFVTVFSL